MTVPNFAPSSAQSSRAFPATASLEDLQSEEQRHVLNAIAQIRKCGLDAVLSLPQLVVCGEQSAGKSSVLEALTEIPFPRKENLCTRFATEITLRYAAIDSLRLRIIPYGARSAMEKNAINAFSETIQDFSELPTLMAKAMVAMGLDPNNPTSRGFSRDVLSIEIEGPKRQQLTLVDLPGLIQTETKGITKSDLEAVEDITDFYIQQPRTICLAIINATHDYATQTVLTKVREVDPEGHRTLGVITKPDRLEHGSGLESAFLGLARNEDIFFRLGWHVVKNRGFEESSLSIDERNDSEASYFRKSNFQQLHSYYRGIDALRTRLSGLLFEHIKRELPNLRKDLDGFLTETTSQLDALGSQRATAQDCRNYLTDLSLTCMTLTRSAINGHYEGDYFRFTTNDEFDVKSPTSVRRFRAVVQLLNKGFANTMNTDGPKYQIQEKIFSSSADDWKSSFIASAVNIPRPSRAPKLMTRAETLDWVKKVWVRSRGKEPFGNYNALIIGELFWEQSFKWKDIAEEHVEQIAQTCKIFLDTLLQETCLEDVHARLTALKISEALRTRQSKAMEELQRIIEDDKDFPVVYTKYYDTYVQETRTKRAEDALNEAVRSATRYTDPLVLGLDPKSSIDSAALVREFRNKIDPPKEYHACEEALDYLVSMYNVSNQHHNMSIKTANESKSKLGIFLANVTNQVIERHMIRSLDKIFSPLDVNGLSDDEILKVASEPASTRRRRDFLMDRQDKLFKGKIVFQDAIAGIR